MYFQAFLLDERNFFLYNYNDIFSYTGFLRPFD